MPEGLVGYGASIYKILPRTGYFVRKILDGADPSNLPIEQATGLELIINLSKSLRRCLPELTG